MMIPADLHRWALGAAVIVFVALQIYVTGRQHGAAACEARVARATAALNRQIAALAAKQATADAEHRAATEAAVRAATAGFGNQQGCRPIDAAARRRLDAIDD